MELSEKKKLFSNSINIRQIILISLFVLIGLAILFVLIGNKFSNQTIRNDNFSVNDAIIIFGLIISAIIIASIYFAQKTPRQILELVKPKHDLRREIMERHNSGEELRISEQHNYDIIEKSLGFICTHKLDGTLLSINPAAANSLGYSPGEMIGKKISDFMEPSARRFFNGYLNKIQKKSRTFRHI